MDALGCLGRFLCLAAFCGLLPHAAFAGSSNSLMDISADGKLLACTNRDSGTVSVVDLNSRTKLHEVAVGTKPEGTSFLGDTHTLAVAVYGDDRVTFLDADAGKVLGSLDVFDEPYGIVSNKAGDRIYVTLDYPGEVLEIDADGRKVLRTFKAGSFLRGIAWSGTDNRIYVSEYFTGVVRAIDLEAGEIADEWQGSSRDNLARQITLHPHRPKAYLAHLRSRTEVKQGTGSIAPILSILNTAPGEGRRRTTIPLDSFHRNFVVSNPWETDVSPDGRHFYAVFSGTDDLFACEVVDDDYSQITLRDIIRLGHNPRAVRVAPDGKTFYVYNALDFNVVAYDAETLEPRGAIEVSQNPLGEEILLGKILFYSANQPMSSQRWIACSSCHPDGQQDGRTWQNPEGLRNTQALFGMAWTYPIHWSADRDELQDFEHTIRGPLMQGRGLIRGRVHDSLDKPNGRLSAELDAVAAYTNSHKFLMSPHSKQGLSEEAQRGRELFVSKETGCATCHSGPFYADSQPGQPFKMHDVGTGEDDPTEKLGPKFDTPTLLGVYRTAPYLHHGKAETLKDVLTTCNQGDRHGKTSHLSPAQLDDLVEFLKALPYEDPEPAAKAAGLTKIDR